MALPSRGPWLLKACGLPQAWQGLPAWRVLDTGFDDGQAFLNTWQAWAADAARPRLLHYVAITPTAPALSRLLDALSAYPALAPNAAILRQQWFGLLPGFHRLALDQGRVLLTLCIGPLQPILREQQFVADAVYLQQGDGLQHSEVWDRWCVKALARLCRRGTALAGTGAMGTLAEDLQQAGFAVAPHTPDGVPPTDTGSWATGFKGQFQPSWEPRQTRDDWHATPAEVSSCAIIGAGLAGATAAASLARRGWRVTVLDAAAAPAAGASGLPAGLFSPHVSRDDSARSRLSRAGIRQTLVLCDALLPHGTDWAQSGVREMCTNGVPALPQDWPAQGRPWSEDLGTVVGPPPPPISTNGHSRREALWHAAGGWVKPARLVLACLNHPGVRFVGQSRIERIVRADGQWLLMDKDGRELARAAQLVISAAGDSVRLAGRAAEALAGDAGNAHGLAAMPTIAGQISWGAQQDGDTALFPAFPVNGLGSFVPAIPMDDGTLAWFAGATYETQPATQADTAVGHGENLDRLAQLLPATARALATRFADQEVSAWRGTRCTTIDRLPAVGPLDTAPQPCLWISAGMGSRGLTYAAVGAELLAARLGAEPLPVEASLWKVISAGRPALKSQDRVAP